MEGQATFDLSTAIERQKPRGFLVMLVFVSWLVTFFDGFDMNVISFTSKQLEAAFHLTSPMLGNVFSIGIFGTLLPASCSATSATGSGGGPRSSWPPAPSRP
ncbi:MAG: hypothetical protein WDM92_04005 [Caulobacteraceae bacterium]